MGTYSATTDVTARLGTQVYGLLGVNDGSDVSANTTLLAAITYADSVIDGYIATRYELPLTSVPDSLKTDACNIVRKFLLDTRPDMVTEGDVVAYNDAIRHLRDISKGVIHLGVTEANEPEVDGTPEIKILGEDLDEDDDNHRTISSPTWWNKW